MALFCMAAAWWYCLKRFNHQHHRWQFVSILVNLFGGGRPISDLFISLLKCGCVSFNIKPPDFHEGTVMSVTWKHHHNLAVDTKSSMKHQTALSVLVSNFPSMHADLSILSVGNDWRKQRRGTNISLFICWPSKYHQYDVIKIFFLFVLFFIGQIVCFNRLLLKRKQNNSGSQNGNMDFAFSITGDENWWTDWHY
jgi:hypothetical protein